MSWAERADAAQRALVDHFWDGRRGLYRAASRAAPASRPPQWHYWWQAHALDAAVDAVAPDAASRRAGTASGPTSPGSSGATAATSPTTTTTTWPGWPSRCCGPTRSPGVDTGALVAELWADIRRAGTSGTAAWSGGATTRYTNTPANAPSAILAARLHRRHGDPADLDWARRIADWQQATLVDPEQRHGLGRHPPGDRPGAEPRAVHVQPGHGRRRRGASSGAVTGDRGHLERARRTAAAALNRFADPASGLCRSRAPATAASSRASWPATWASWCSAVRTRRTRSPARALAMLRRNGEAVAAAGDRPVGADWSRPADERSEPVHPPVGGAAAGGSRGGGPLGFGAR